MNIAIAFSRTLFPLLSIIFITSYMISLPMGSKTVNALVGVLLGLGLAILLRVAEKFFQRFSLRAFNLTALGLFFGYLMGKGLTLIFQSLWNLGLTTYPFLPLFEILKISLFLFGVYLGTLLTIRNASEIHLSIPFIKLSPLAYKKRDLLLDGSSLADMRIIDLAATGLLDNQLLIPTFLIKDLQILSEFSEESSKNKARQALETLQKLQALPHLDLRYHEADLPDSQDPLTKMLRLAKFIDANILTADISKVQSDTPGIRIISLHTLSSALKPLAQTGEEILIKIQRHGKEPRQGIGYLEDGTMVVVNGGGDYIGESIEAKVLSVKHTTSGRLIFCNAKDEASLSCEIDY